MKYFLLFLIILSGYSVYLLNPNKVLASHQRYVSQPVCSYGSTQARVQLDISDPWKQNISIKHDEQFNVGGFHDGTGQFANDTIITVYGPGLSRTAVNGETIRNLSAGKYTVIVTTKNQSGGGCTETATVYVKSVPIPQSNIQIAPAPSYMSPSTCYCTYPVHSKIFLDSQHKSRYVVNYICEEAH